MDSEPLKTTLLDIASIDLTIVAAALTFFDYDEFTPDSNVAATIRRWIPVPHNPVMIVFALEIKFKTRCGVGYIPRRGAI